MQFIMKMILNNNACFIDSQVPVEKEIINI